MVKLQNQQGVGLEYNQGDFNRDLWSDFSPTKASKVLFSSSEAFVGYKDLTLGGLLAWTLRPNNHVRRRSIISTIALKNIARAEQASQRRYGASLKADFHARHVMLGDAFFLDVYPVIGGMGSAFQRTFSKSLADRFRTERTSSQHAVQITRIMHYAHSRQPDLALPSLNRATVALRAMTSQQSVSGGSIGFDAHHGRQIDLYWRNHVDSIAYLYAAANTSTSPTRTLYMDLFSSSFAITSTAPWIHDWLSRAAYASTILAHNYSKAALNKNLDAAPNCEPRPFSASPFNDAELETLTTIFSKDYDLKNQRLRTG